MAPLLRTTDAGLYCEAGDFHIDPWKPVSHALITHAHADHARAGSAQYVATKASLGVLHQRLGADTQIDGVDYGQTLDLNGVRVSFHSAGHVLGSAQIRVEHGGEVWVASGDYKRAPDPTCTPFEVVPCDVFITEATFGLPVYRWDPGEQTARQILAWWEQNRARGRCSVLYAYAFGKSQRILAELARLCDYEEIFTHGAVETLVERYREAGVPMLPTRKVVDQPKGTDFSRAMVLAPPSAHVASFLKRLGPCETAFASGWMRVRGNRRRRGFGRGFVLSDHADWPALLRTVHDCGARRVLVTHGFSEVLCRYLSEQGVQAERLETAYLGESGTDEEGADA